MPPVLAPSSPSPDALEVLGGGERDTMSVPSTEHVQRTLRARETLFDDDGATRLAEGRAAQLFARRRAAPRRGRW